MKSKVPLALLALRISTVIYYLIMAGCLAWAVLASGSPEDDAWIIAVVLLIFLVPFVVFLEVLIFFLRRRRFWAWVAGIVIGALYAPSLFMPLGIMILVGLLADGSRSEFGLQKASAAPGSPTTKPGNPVIRKGQ